jgi:heme exporter protein B
LQAGFGMKTASFIALVQRDLRIARRRPTEALLPVVFFVVACSLFPLGVGPESSTLRQIAPGIVWVCALVSALLSLHTMYGTDFADGSLEQMLLADQFPMGIALAKALAHWCMTGIPLLLAAPALGLLFDMPVASIGILALTLVLGTPVLSLMGGVGAALTLGLRNGALLILLLVLPLCIPVLIFGAGAVSALDMGLSPLGHLYLLGALLLLALLGAPVATAAALRISI